MGVLDDGGERELVPAQQWRGPLAFPNFFEDAQRARGDEFEWSLQHPSDGIELVVGYRLEQATGSSA